MSPSPNAKVPKPDPTSPSPVSSVAKTRKPNRDTPAKWEGIVKKTVFFPAGFLFCWWWKVRSWTVAFVYVIYIYKLYICVGYIRIVYDSVKKPPENQLCYFNNLTFFLLSEPHLCRPPWPYVAPSTRLATPCMSKLNPHLQAEEWNSWGHPASAWSPVQQQFLGHGGGQTIMGMKVMSGQARISLGFAMLTMCHFVGATLLLILVHDWWCVNHTVQHLCIHVWGSKM